MFATNVEALGMTPLWIAWFLENHIISQKKAAYIWNK